MCYSCGTLSCATVLLLLNYWSKQIIMNFRDVGLCFHLDIHHNYTTVSALNRTSQYQGRGLQHGQQTEHKFSLHTSHTHIHKYTLLVFTENHKKVPDICILYLVGSRQKLA